MASVVISGDTSGTATIQAQAVAGNTVLTLPTTSGTILTNTGGVTPGTSGNVLTSDGTNWISSTGPIGVGQTWTDVTASRAYGTTYTNSTGKPIAVSVSGTASGGGNGSFVQIAYVNGNEIASQTSYAANAGYRHSVFFIVPNGATYSVTGTGGILSTTLYLWSELR